jgi:hypothetical protein
VYSGRTGAQLESFLAYEPTFTAGIFSAGVIRPPVRAITEAATDVSTTTARLNGTVDASGRSVTVKFQYGLTANLGTTVNATPNVVTGTAPTSVNAVVMGLQPGRTYFYRVIALDGLGGTVAGNIRTFSTDVNIPPSGGTFAVTPASPVAEGTVLTATFAGWTDVDGHTPLRYEVREGRVVIAPISEDPVVEFILPAGTHLLTGRVYDQLGAVTEVGPVEVVVTGVGDHTLYQAARDPVPGAGGGGIPADAKWTSFGVPAMSNSTVVYLGNFTSPTGKGTGIFSNDTVKVLTNSPVPGAGGGGDLALPADAFFKKFKDPVTDAAGNIAFIATIGGTGVSGANDTVVVSNARTGSFEVLAREGTPAPGTGTGKYGTLQNVSIAGGGTMWTALVKGVPAAENAGAWWLPSGAVSPILLVQKGDALAGDTIKTFILLQSWPATPGHGRGQLDGNEALLQVILKSGAQAMVKATPGTLTVLAATGDPIAGGLEWVRMAQPSANGAGSYLSVRGNVRPDTAPATSLGSISVMVSADAGLTWTELAGVSDIAAGTDAVWVDLGFPVTSRTGTGVAFLGRVRGGSVKPANDSGVWWKPDGGSLELLAQEGRQAVGALAGQNFRAFRSLAYPGGIPGPLFVATLAGTGVSGINDMGAWVVDSSGSLRLLFRDGDRIGTKRVGAFNFLSEVSGSAGATRAFNDNGNVAWRATFTDRTTGIVVSRIW